MNFKFFKFIAFLLLISLNLNATSLRDAVEETINTNPDIVAEHFNKKAFRTNIDEQKRDYYPTLDFATFVEESHTYNDYEGNTKSGKDDAGKDGWNATLKFEQLLYDGGKTPNEVELYRHRYNNIKFTSKEKVEDLIFQIVNTYTQLVSYQELIALDNVKINIHKKYLQQAKDAEKISGEKLDTIQVKSKINAIMDNYLEQEVNQQKAFSAYKKLSGKKLTGNICRPILDEKLIPKSIDDAIEIALRKNNVIRAQRSMIKEQKARARVSQSSFRPDLKFQVEGSWDNDLDLAENGQRDIYRMRFQSNWNLFNGGKDSVVHERERIFILEQRKILDSIKDEVIDKIKGSYNTYYKIKDRLKNLQEFINVNNEIVEIYNLQLQDGSRTFLDLLNAEAELFRTKVLYIQTEFTLYNEYFSMLKALDMLSDVILIQNNQICTSYALDDPMLKRDKEDNELSELEEESDLGLD